MFIFLQKVLTRTIVRDNIDIERRDNMTIVKNKPMILFIVSVIGIVYLGALCDIKQNNLNTNLVCNDIEMVQEIS